MSVTACSVTSFILKNQFIHLHWVNASGNLYLLLMYIVYVLRFIMYILLSPIRPSRPILVCAVVFRSIYCMLMVCGRIRSLCHFVVNLKYFDTFIMIVICASSVALAWEDPVHGESSSKNQVLKYLDDIFTGVFTVEMILKVRYHCDKNINQHQQCMILVFVRNVLRIAYPPYGYMH